MENQTKFKDTEISRIPIDISPFPNRDTFYYLKKRSLSNIRDIIRWADKNGFRTMVTMLDVNAGSRKIQSDKGFTTLIGLINVKAKPYFRIILRKNLNVNRIISDKIHEEDILEIGIRGIDVDSKEYFIMIFLEPRFLDELKEKYELKEVG